MKNRSVFQIQTPSRNVPSPNKPGLQRDEIEQLKDIIDLCVSHETKINCPRYLRSLSDSIINDRTKYISLKRLGNFYYAMETLSGLLIESDDPLKQFISKIKKEFELNNNRAKPYQFNDERTIFIEIFAPMFRYFALFTKELVFVWGEKAIKQMSSLYIVDANYVKSGVNRKLLDGIGTLEQEDISWLLLESSGYSEQQNYNHSVEDCLKNIKNGTDSLKYVMSKFKNASINTMKKMKIFSVQIINTKMTLICYQLHSGNKWQAYECCSCTMPLLNNQKSLLIPVFEMFAYLFEEIATQKPLYETLRQESLGLLNVEDQDKILTLLTGDYQNQ